MRKHLGMALALWPAGPAVPEWLLRTRAACFGSVGSGLPDAGGWILLIGQPIGMLAFLLAVWGDSLRSEIRRLGTHRAWRLAGLGVAAAGLAGIASVARLVLEARALEAAQLSTGPGIPIRIALAPPAIELTDQYGKRGSLARAGGPAIVGFAFGHCNTVCPTLVRDLRAARLSAGRPDLPILIVTLDPWRDTPERLPALALQWGLTGESDRVLSGTVMEVEETLNRLGIGRRRDLATGDILHTGTVMLLDPTGQLTWRLDGGWGGVKDLLALDR